MLRNLKCLPLIFCCMLLPFAANANKLYLMNVEIATAARGTITLKLGVAAEPEERAAGLMGVKKLESFEGMIFLFPVAHDYHFWMKNTLIPLDMLFVDADNRIVHIEANATPQSLTPRGSGQPIAAVIELDGGRASREGIAKGDHIRYALPPNFEIK